MGAGRRRARRAQKSGCAPTSRPSTLSRVGRVWPTRSRVDTAVSARSVPTVRPRVSRSGRWWMSPTPKPTQPSPRSSVPSVPTPARTPVIVGVGQAEQRVDDPAAALEPIDLLHRAVDAALDDSGAVVASAGLDRHDRRRADRVVELSRSRCTARTTPRRGRRAPHRHDDRGRQQPADVAEHARDGHRERKHRRRGARRFRVHVEPLAVAARAQGLARLGRTRRPAVSRGRRRRPPGQQPV